MLGVTPTRSLRREWAVSCRECGSEGLMAELFFRLHGIVLDARWYLTTSGTKLLSTSLSLD
jgi:hypothetical protein